MSTYRPLVVTSITVLAFDRKRELGDNGLAGGLSADTAYRVTRYRGEDMFFYTPDGRGGYWYDTLEEMRNENE